MSINAEGYEINEVSPLIASDCCFEKISGHGTESREMELRGQGKQGSWIHKRRWRYREGEGTPEVCKVTPLSLWLRTDQQRCTKNTAQDLGKNHPNGLKRKHCLASTKTWDSACSYQPEWKHSSLMGHWGQELRRAVPQQWEIISPRLSTTPVPANKS